MRIIHVCVALDKQFGGPPNAIFDASLALVRSGNAVSVLSLGNSKRVVDSFMSSHATDLSSQTDQPNFYLGKTLIENKYGIGFPVLFSTKLMFTKVDLIICHQIYTFPNIITYCIARFRKIPYVIMPHGSLEPYHESYHRWRKRLLRILIINSFLKKAESVLVAHPSEMEHMPENLRSKGIVVGLGIDIIDRYAPKVFVPNRLVLTFVGRITKKKRVDLVIRSLPQFIQMRPEIDIHFNIVGDGEKSDVQFLQGLIQDLDLSSKVDLLGWKNRYEIDEVLEKSDAYIHISENENFSISVAEALNHQLPVILSREVALASLVERFNAGLVVEERSVESIVLALLQVDASHLQIFSENAGLAVKELSWESVGLNWQKMAFSHKRIAS